MPMQACHTECGSAQQPCEGIRQGLRHPQGLTGASAQQGSSAHHRRKRSFAHMSVRRRHGCTHPPFFSASATSLNVSKLAPFALSR